MGNRWIVVGAGSAGCVVASRLSEDPDREVVLLEAGPATAPVAGAAAVDGPDFLAALVVPGLTYEELAATRTSGGASTPYARGRGLGGSSLVNAMVALEADAALMPGCTTEELVAARHRLAVSIEEVPDDGLGLVDRALAAAAPDTERARLTRRDGRRHTSADAYLGEIADRANLSVSADTIVDRILFDRRRATGVRTERGVDLDADHVVLCAGAIHTPAVLLRSGVDTPGVGEGLQDHPSVTFTLQLARGGAERGGLVIGSLLRRGHAQVLPMNHLGVGADGLGALLVAAMAPTGRGGTVRLATDDPNDEPEVDFALLGAPGDLDSLVAAARLGSGLLDHDAFAEIVEHVYIDPFGTPRAALRDGDAVRRWVAGAVGDYVHATGTCAIGRVVDGDGAVVGYERLRVCDASLFPQIPDVNTHLPTTLLAEVLVERWRRVDRADHLEG